MKKVCKYTSNKGEMSWRYYWINGKKHGLNEWWNINGEQYEKKYILL